MWACRPPWSGMDSLFSPSSLSFRQSLITEINADAQHPRPGRSPAPSTSHQTTPIEPGYITSVTSSSITGRCSSPRCSCSASCTLSYDSYLLKGNGSGLDKPQSHERWSRRSRTHALGLNLTILYGYVCLSVNVARFFYQGRLPKRSFCTGSISTTGSMCPDFFGTRCGDIWVAWTRWRSYPGWSREPPR
jgi:hypothetical protein